MNLRFTSDALADLDELKVWLKPRAPNGYRRVLARLTAKIRTLRLHPDIGHVIAYPDIRAIAETRYGFVIPYRVRDNTIWILRIYNARRYPLDYDALVD
jgi:toxin ParE1/3/4